MNIYRNLPIPGYPQINFAPEGDEGGGGDPKLDQQDAGGQDKGGDAGADKGGDQGAGSFLADADNDKNDDKTKIVAPADWPQDWRDKLAGGDKDARKRLDRFKAPTDIFKSYTELEARFKSGKSPAADEPMPDPEKDPDAAKEWRKARGVPDDPTGYAIPDAVKALVTDADKPALAEFTEVMHAKGVPASAVGPVMEWYFQREDANRAALAEADKENIAALQDELRGEWGADFRPNSTIAKRYAEKLFPDIPFYDARLPDGRRIGDIPGIVRALASAGQAEFGDVSFAGGEASMKTQNRKAELQAMLKDDPEKYFGNPAYSKELTEINEAELKRANSRSAG